MFCLCLCVCLRARVRVCLRACVQRVCASVCVRACVRVCVHCAFSIQNEIFIFAVMYEASFLMKANKLVLNENSLKFLRDLMERKTKNEI